MTAPDNKMVILRDLAEHGPTSTPVIAARLVVDVQRVRNNLLAMLRPKVGWVARTEPGGKAGHVWSITAAGKDRLAEKEGR